jgi:hypothetical protein
LPVDWPDSIDIVSQGEAGEIHLVISDHLDWINSVEHQLILQRKLNTYLRFIESGELFEKFPSARTNPFYTEIVFQHEPDEDGYIFVERAKSIFGEAGLLLTHRIFAARRP